jgi:hypothetical protein
MYTVIGGQDVVDFIEGLTRKAQPVFEYCLD